MSPRRLFAGTATLAVLRPIIQAELSKVPPIVLGQEGGVRLRELLEDAIQQGASIWGEFDPAQQSPLLVDHAKATMAIARSDFFAPVLSLIEVPSMTSVPELYAQSPFGLTAAIFGDETEARSLAPSLRAGTVLVNDVIAPTADPRVTFGGRGSSGYGVTRGAEGLLEMTAIKMLLVQRGRATWYMEPTRDSDAPMFEAAIRALHGRFLGERLTAVARILRSIRKYLKSR